MKVIPEFLPVCKIFRLALATLACSSVYSQNAVLDAGPFTGHVTTSTANIWTHVTEAGNYTLEYTAQGESEVNRVTLATSNEQDNTLTWNLSGLATDKNYSYSITQDQGSNLLGQGFTFSTLKPHDQLQQVKMYFGSCAREKMDNPVWDAILQAPPDVLVLIGDTPYIDNTNLNVQLTRYFEFATNGLIAPVLKAVPWYSVWDDHDFGLNDTDGNLSGKENSRRAFSLYRPNPSFGDGTEGIYTNFRRGPLEVFLLDTRYFAATEISEFDAGEQTLLGTAQWAWLKESLVASTAPFKLLCSGMIWNGAVRPGKPDHWDSYPAEKAGVFRFINENRVSGIFLMGGDVHRSRALKYPLQEEAGYAITELITSPMHDGPMESANAPHDNLVFDAGVQYAYMSLTANTGNGSPTLTAAAMTADGTEHFGLTLVADSLRSPDWPVNIHKGQQESMGPQWQVTFTERFKYRGEGVLYQVTLSDMKGERVASPVVVNNRVHWSVTSGNQARVRPGVYALTIKHSMGVQHKNIYIR